MTKRLTLAVLVLTAVAVTAPSAFAVCPTPPAGPYYMSPLSWWDYTPEQTCLSDNGDQEYSTMWCYSTPAWTIGTSSQANISYTFTASEDDLEYWDSSIRVEFNDPTNSSSNWVELWAKVTHNGVTTSTLLWQFDGADGDLSCARRGGSFTAVTGDTVKIEIKARKVSGTATIQVSVPMIFAYIS
ncbi:MAG TPA: hypothetical protein VKB93_06015 [Thermoanaerobaculia bacterium]|nr:hypothetical protein [Thermoanaerobaculia bacterium]